MFLMRRRYKKIIYSKNPGLVFFFIENDELNRLVYLKNERFRLNGQTWSSNGFYASTLKSNDCIDQYTSDETI